MATEEAVHDSAVPIDKKQKKWFPLESNPVLLNGYIEKLGFDTSKYSFHDVFSTEEWATDMIPSPVAAVIMLYPITGAQEDHRDKERVEVIPKQSVSSEVWHMTQRIGNACGTIGILHALRNAPSDVQSGCIKDGSWLRRYYSRCPSTFSADDKADALDSDDEIEDMHDKATADDTNATGRGGIEDRVDTHFVAIVHVDGGLYELDGRKGAPIRHGDTSSERFLRDACGVVQTFMNRDPGEMRFTILALAPTQKDD